MMNQSFLGGHIRHVRQGLAMGGQVCCQTVAAADGLLPVKKVMVHAKAAASSMALVFSPRQALRYTRSDRFTTGRMAFPLSEQKDHMHYGESIYAFF